MSITDHLKAHAGDFILPIDEVASRILSWADGVPVSNRDGRVAEVIFPTETFGYVGVVETPERTKVFWGYREGRDRPSPFIRVEKREEIQGLVVIGQWQKGEFVLMTTFPGSSVNPSEPHTMWLWKEGNEAKLAESIAFWTSHAFVLTQTEHVDPVFGPDIDSVLAGNQAEAKEMLGKLSDPANQIRKSDPAGCELDTVKISDKEIDIQWQAGCADYGGFTLYEDYISPAWACGESFAPNLQLLAAFGMSKEDAWKVYYAPSSSPIYPQLADLGVSFEDAKVRVIRILISWKLAEVSQWRHLGDMNRVITTETEIQDLLKHLR